VAAEHTVDEPRGQVQKEITAERPHGLFDVRAVLEGSIEYHIEDLVVVGGSGKRPPGVFRRVLQRSQLAPYSPHVIFR
jgi:hypothetical protein